MLYVCILCSRSVWLLLFEVVLLVMNFLTRGIIYILFLFWLVYFIVAKGIKCLIFSLKFKSSVVCTSIQCSKKWPRRWHTASPRPKSAWLGTRLGRLGRLPGPLSLVSFFFFFWKGRLRARLLQAAQLAPSSFYNIASIALIAYWCNKSKLWLNCTTCCLVTYSDNDWMELQVFMITLFLTCKVYLHDCVSI